MTKIAIVGAGASGLMAALVAKNDKNEIDLYEKNNKIGKKIAISGNGKCNISNTNILKEHYFGNNLNFLEFGFREFGYKKFKNFCASLGLYLKEESDGRVYPSSYESLSVLSIFEQNLKQKRVNFYLSSEVVNIEKKEDKFIVYIKDKKPKIYDRVLVSTGSRAAAPLGGGETALNIAKKFGHKIYETYPALVQLESADKRVSLLSGVKIDAKVSLIDDKIGKKQTRGDVLFTGYGLSGFAILDISLYVSKIVLEKEKVDLYLELLPDMDKEQLQALLLKSLKNNPLYCCEMMLHGILPVKIAKVISKEAGLLGKRLNKINTKDIKRLVYIIKNWRWSITKTHGFKYAEVCGGGIDTTQIDSKTMESKLVKYLYFSAEALDIVGKRGGYNLSFAWMSGYLAGKALAKG